MWVDYRGSLSTVYNDGEISTCGKTIPLENIRSTYKSGGNKEIILCVYYICNN